MSAPRIKVRIEDFGFHGWPWFTWSCTGCAPMKDNCPGGTWSSLAAAADAGRKHLAEHHEPTVGTYCRGHGCSRFECGCIGYVIQADAERLLRVENASDYPDALNAALARHAQHGTGTSGPLDKAHNEGSRR